MEHEISTTQDTASAHGVAGLVERLRAGCSPDDPDTLEIEAATALETLSARLDEEKRARDAAEARVKVLEDALEQFAAAIRVRTVLADAETQDEGAGDGQ